MGFFMFLLTVALIFSFFKLVKQERRISDLEMYVESVSKTVAKLQPVAASSNAAE